MENDNDLEPNAKASELAYSNDHSHSQSRKSDSIKSSNSGSILSGSSGYGCILSNNGGSDSIKSSNSGSHFSGSSGYGCILSANVDSNTIDLPLDERPKDKELVKKKPREIDNLNKDAANLSSSRMDDVQSSGEDIPAIFEEYVVNLSPKEKREPENIKIPTKDHATEEEDGFSCMVSINEGMILFVDTLVTTNLGFLNEMWVGRSFIEFVHPKDRNTLASQITSSPIPSIVNKEINKAQESTNNVFCRVRKYRNLSSGFSVKEKDVTYSPYLLKLYLKTDKKVDVKAPCLLIIGTPCASAYTIPHEPMTKSIPFIIRHIANGTFDYIDPQSVPYLGHFPQDMTAQCALELYHPDDLIYLRQVYETIVREGHAPNLKSFRLLTQSGDYVRVETEWSSFMNPWSKKLEFVTAKHIVIEGPTNPDVFFSPEPDLVFLNMEESMKMAQAQARRDKIVMIMNEVLTKPSESIMAKKLKDLSVVMQSLPEDETKITCSSGSDVKDNNHNFFDVDDMLLAGISPHRDYNDMKSPSETHLSYSQLNYNENLQRFFDSYLNCDKVDDVQLEENDDVQYDENLPPRGVNMSPMANASADSGGATSSGESAMFSKGECSSPKVEEKDNEMLLTESLLNKHNIKMKREFIKKHRVTKARSCGEREVFAQETKKRKMEHLTRCNANYQDGNHGMAHGIKRGSGHLGDLTNSKHAKTSSQPSSRYLSTSPLHKSTSNMGTFSGYPFTENMQTNCGLMPNITPVAGYPVYIMPIPPSPIHNDASHNEAASSVQQEKVAHTLIRVPFMYSPVNPHMPFTPIHASTHGSFGSQTFIPPTTETWRDYDEIHNRRKLISKSLISRKRKHTNKRKLNEPWVQKVSVPSDLLYKYQIKARSKEDVLSGDKRKIDHFEQPNLVSDQLGQLYLDMQLAGVASKLTLEEGATSSGSSGEDSGPKPKLMKRAKEYSKLSLVYEEDAPLPSP